MLQELFETLSKRVRQWYGTTADFLKNAYQRRGEVVLFAQKILAVIKNLWEKADFENFKRSNLLPLARKEFYVSQTLFWKRVVLAMFKNVSRNKLLAGVTIFVLSLIVLIFNVTLSINDLLNTSLARVGEKVDLVVWIDDNADQFQISSLKTDLERLPEVKTVVYTSKEDALKIFQKDNPETYLFLKRYQLQNPLPASFGIQAQKVEDNLKIMNFLKRDRYKSTINQNKIKDNSEDRRRTEKLISVTNFIAQAGKYLLSLFLMIVIIITFNTINLLIQRRAREIAIMRIVGAKYSFIRLPFILEGALYALLSFALGLVFMYGFIYKFKQKLSVTLADEDVLLKNFQNTVAAFLHEFNNLIGYELLIAVFIGIFSSYLAIEWYLRKENLVREE